MYDPETNDLSLDSVTTNILFMYMCPEEIVRADGSNGYPLQFKGHCYLLEIVVEPETAGDGFKVVPIKQYLFHY